MKHIKTFEAKSDEEKKKKKEENDDLFQALLDENPLSKDHDFYVFIGKDEFIENEDGSYRKSLYIENMVRMTKDTYGYVEMMHMRARFQSDSVVYHIWLPMELREEVEGNGSGSMDDWLIDIINKYKMKGVTEEGRQVYQDVVKRKKRIRDVGL